MQFTDLVLGVLAQFPESPERCHSDRLRGEETPRLVTKQPTTTNREDRATSVTEEERQSGFKALPPGERMAPASLLSAATPTAQIILQGGACQQNVMPVYLWSGRYTVAAVKCLVYSTGI